MQLLAILGVLLLSLVILMGAAGQTRKPVPAKPTAPPPQTTTAETVKSMSRAEIESMLKKIETSEAPKPKMGAMCYDVAMPPNRGEYVCPVCGEKTLYATKNEKDPDSKDGTLSVDWPAIKILQWDLKACRREMEAIHKDSKLALTLDESSFCKKCQPKAKKQELQLKVTYDDGKTYTVSSINHSDLLLLRDFLKGQLSFATENDGTYPIRQNLKRLRELLVMPPPKETKNETKPAPNK
ncbi:MAG: hypothetical protein PVH19_04450 [Planctomycetia bacterium]|jgi:hypothetical protein